MKERIILQITGMTCTKYGEVERFLLDLVRLSNRVGYRSILQYESLPAPKSYLRDLEALGAKVIICPVNKNPIVACWNVARLVGSVRPEIIHAHFVERFGLFFVPMIGRMFRVKKIINSVHYKRWGGNKCVRFAYNMFDHVLPCSSAVKDDLTARGVNPRHLAVQYLGVSGEHATSPELRSRVREEFGIPCDAVVFACIAFDTEFKGLDILLEAFAMTRRKHKDLHLISIGVNPRDSKLPAQAAQLGISPQVHWAGIRDDGWRVLNAADVYVQPSRFGEGLSLSILEAMSMKLPVVCTRVAGNGEAVIDGYNGILVEPDNLESLVDALNCMIAQRSRWSEFGTAGYNRYVEIFQGEKLRDEFVNKYYR